MSKLKVLVCGALGRMGREAVQAVLEDPEVQLCGAVDLNKNGEDIGEAVTGEKAGVEISAELAGAVAAAGPDVVVDFTVPTAVMENIRTCLKNRVPPVVGTTGLTEADFAEIRELTASHGTGAVVVPNFALGAVLMMKFARMAARFFPQAEVIEMHHDGKVDAPSGTALKTAELMAENREQGAGENSPGSSEEGEGFLEKLPGARGGSHEGIRVHSVRLPGLVAHQEVILGGEGQTLTIRHDSMNRRSFMPGLLMAVKQAPQVEGLVYGLEQLMDLD